MKIKSEHFSLNHYTGLTDSQKNKIIESFNNFDRFSHMIDDNSIKERVLEQNLEIVKKLRDDGVYSIQTEIFDKKEMWLNIEEKFPECFPNENEIYQHLELYPNVGITFYIDDDQIRLFDWLPNSVISGLFKGKEKIQIFTITLDIKDVKEVWMIVLKNNTIVEKFFVGEKRFFVIEESSKEVKDLEVLENLEDLEDFDIENEEFLQQTKSGYDGKIKWIQLLNKLYSEVLDLPKIVSLFSSTYNGRKYLCSGVAINKNMKIIPMVLFLNLQEEFAKKVRADCENNIMFYTYDPRLTGKKIETEYPLNETTEMLSAHEFNLNTRYYRNYKLTIENRSALIKRYGNCLYTIINDLFLKI